MFTKAFVINYDPFSNQGLDEAEELTVVGKSHDYPFVSQDMRVFPWGNWSQGKQMLAKIAKPDSWIEFKFKVKEKGVYRIHVHLTRASDFGIVKVYVNSISKSGDIDLWSGENGHVWSQPFDIGKYLLVKGDDHRIKVQVIGRNPNNAKPHFFFGIDGIRLEKT